MVVADVAPEKLLNRHLKRFDAFLHDEVPDLEAEDELMWVLRRIARRADQLQSNSGKSCDRDYWLEAQREILGFAC